MSNDNAVTIIGTMTRAPELKYLASGSALCEFGLAQNTRIKNKDTGEWEDGDSMFFDVTAWAPLAENIAESLDKGNRVVVFGTLQYRSWKNDAGETRSKISLKAEAVGPDLRFATAQVQKIQRDNGQASQAAPSANPFG